MASLVISLGRHALGFCCLCCHLVGESDKIFWNLNLPPFPHSVWSWFEFCHPDFSETLLIQMCNQACAIQRQFRCIQWPEGKVGNKMLVQGPSNLCWWAAVPGRSLKPKVLLTRGITNNHLHDGKSQKQTQLGCYYIRATSSVNILCLGEWASNPWCNINKQGL